MMKELKMKMKCKIQAYAWALGPTHKMFLHINETDYNNMLIMLESDTKLTIYTMS